MLQNKFVSLPVLTVSRSIILLLLIVLLHLVAFVSITYTVYFHISINLVLGLLILFSFYYYIQYYKNLNQLKQIKCRADGMWVLDFGEKPLLVSIVEPCMITEWLIVLRFRISHSKTRSIPVFVDMLAAEKFKQLRVVLPYILKNKKAQD